MPRCVAVIDIGKTNAKVVLVDPEERRELASETTGNPVIREAPYPHHDADALWRFILEQLGAMHRQQPVDAISITAHGSAAGLIDGERLVLPILDYEHDGPESVAEAYDAVRPPYKETLSPRLPAGLNQGAQIHWQQHAFPETFARVTAILANAQYWAWRLTGQPASEPTSLGAHGDLWMPLHGRFSTLVERLGWTDLFPPLRSPFDILGPILPAVAEATGLPADTPVMCGIHDSNASLLPHLIDREPPFSVVSSGTWVINFSVGGRQVALNPERDCLANVNAFHDPVFCSRFMGGREFEILTGGMMREPSEADIARVLDERIMALPSFTEGIGPYGTHAGDWSHNPDGLTDGVRTAAASLYLALVTQTALELIGADGPVVVEGPLAHNPLFCAALEGVVERPVEPASGTMGSSIGAALLTLGQDAPSKPVPAPSRAGYPRLDGLKTYAQTWRAKIG